MVLSLGGVGVGWGEAAPLLRPALGDPVCVTVDTQSCFHRWATGHAPFCVCIQLFVFSLRGGGMDGWMDGRTDRWMDGGTATGLTCTPTHTSNCTSVFPAILWQDVVAQQPTESVSSSRTTCLL